MPPWLSLLCSILGKNIEFGIMIFLEKQEIDLQSNMQGSKCDEYCICLKELFRFSFYEKVPFPFDPVAFLLKYFYPNSP